MGKLTMSIEESGPMSFSLFRSELFDSDLSEHDKYAALHDLSGSIALYPEGFNTIHKAQVFVAVWIENIRLENGTYVSAFHLNRYYVKDRH